MSTARSRWRLAAVAGGVVTLLAYRALAGYRAANPLVPASRNGLMDEEVLFSETGAQRAERRLSALEEHLADLEDRIGPVVGWFGDDRPCGQRR